MKKPLIIWVSALTLLTLWATLFAQTTTGSSLITQMKAAVHAFTLAGDLNPGVTGLESAPLVGKRTGDMLSAGEYNRLLELVGQGGGGGSNTISLKIKRLTGASESCTSVCLSESKSCVVGFLADNSFSNTGAAVLRWALDCNQSISPAVYSLECLCSSGGGGGGGGGDSAPSGTLCGALFTQRDGVGGTTCTNTNNTAKCAGQTLSMPAACGTNPCAAMTGCPAGYTPVATAYSWGGGQNIHAAVYMYNKCSCAKQ